MFLPLLAGHGILISASAVEHKSRLRSSTGIRTKLRFVHQIARAAVQNPMSKAVALEQPGRVRDFLAVAVTVPSECFQYILRLIAVGFTLMLF